MTQRTFDQADLKAVAGEEKEEDNVEPESKRARVDDSDDSSSIDEEEEEEAWSVYPLPYRDLDAPDWVTADDPVSGWATTECLPRYDYCVHTTLWRSMQAFVEFWQQALLYNPVFVGANSVSCVMEDLFWDFHPNVAHAVWLLFRPTNGAASFKVCMKQTITFRVFSNDMVTLCDGGAWEVERSGLPFCPTAAHVYHRIQKAAEAKQPTLDWIRGALIKQPSKTEDEQSVLYRVMYRHPLSQFRDLTPLIFDLVGQSFILP